MTLLMLYVMHLSQQTRIIYLIELIIKRKTELWSTRGYIWKASSNNISDD